MRGGESVSEVCKSIEVQSTGNPDPREQADCSSQHGVAMGADVDDGADDDANDESNKGKPRGGARKVLSRELLHRRDGHPCQKLSGEAQPAQARRHGDLPSTPAEANVAMFRWSARAALMIGNVSAAPLPSPRRIPKSTNGFNPSACSA